MADEMLINGLIKFCDAKSKNMELKAEPQVYVEIKCALEELKAIKQWKSDVMEGFCKYDASSFEEIVVNARAKAIDEFAEKMKKIIEKDLANPDLMLDCKKCGIWRVEEIDEIAEQMKGGGKNG